MMQNVSNNVGKPSKAPNKGVSNTKQKEMTAVEWLRMTKLAFVTS